MIKLNLEFWKTIIYRYSRIFMRRTVTIKSTAFNQGKTICTCFQLNKIFIWLMHAWFYAKRIVVQLVYNTTYWSLLKLCK